MAEDFVIEMLHITKEFPGIKANDDITLQLRKGEVHARTAGGVLIGAFDLYVVCDDIDIADDRIAWDLIY